MEAHLAAVEERAQETAEAEANLERLNAEAAELERQVEAEQRQVEALTRQRQFDDWSNAQDAAFAGRNPSAAKLEVRSGAYQNAERKAKSKGGPTI